MADAMFVCGCLARALPAASQGVGPFDGDERQRAKEVIIVRRVFSLLGLRDSTRATQKRPTIAGPVVNDQAAASPAADAGDDDNGCSVAQRQAEHLRLAVQLEAAALQHRLAAASAVVLNRPPDPVADLDDPAEDQADDLAPDESEAADVAVHVLGPFKVATGDRTVVWGGTRSRMLFQFLLLRARPVRREELMELLWPGYSYQAARNNLNVCLHGARRSLQPGEAEREHIVYRDGCYGLNKDLVWAVDRDRFVSLSNAAHSLAARRQLAGARRAAACAVAAYGGHLLQDETAAEWFEPDRHWLHEQYLGVLELEVEVRLDLDDVDGARATARRIMCEDPSRESGHRLLMRCYARQHQGDLLARQYHQCVNTLEQQLGIGPTPETVRLYHELSRSTPNQSNAS